MAKYKKGSNDKNYGIFVVSGMVIALAQVSMITEPMAVKVKKTREEDEEPVEMLGINIYMSGVRDPLKVFIDDEAEAKDCYLDMMASIETYYTKDIKAVNHSYAPGIPLKVASLSAAIKDSQERNAIMTLDEAERIIAEYDEWDDVSCSCYVDSAPCKKCENMPSPESVREAELVIEHNENK